jgi:hypothetical protein
VTAAPPDDAPEYFAASEADALDQHARLVADRSTSDVRQPGDEADSRWSRRL